MSRWQRKPSLAVFFDLDGTLVDTAPDMIAALQDLQASLGVPPIDYALGRSHVSNGAMGLLQIAFPGASITPDGELMCDYIARYAASVCDRSRLFSGLDQLLDDLDGSAVPWGIVTNKPMHLTDPILDRLALTGRAVCAISGDTLPTRKPDPAPLLHACELAEVKPQHAIYIGDAARDIEAGLRAGMQTVAATYGYITEDQQPGDWGAHELVADTAELAQFVRKAVNLST